MSTISNARSPLYYKSLGTGSVASIKWEIKIYTGTQTPVPSDIQYTIIKNTFEETILGNPYQIAPIEIGELVRDYLYTDYYTEAIDAVWLEVTATHYSGLNGTGSVVGSPATTTSLAFDGYTYFEEGIGARGSADPATSPYTPQLLQDNTTVYFIKGEDIKLPIFAESLATISFSIGGATSFWNAVDDYWETYDVSWANTTTVINISDDGNTNQKIQYVNITGTENLSDGEIITISNGVYSDITTITLREICELKYTPYRVIFYNKYGALQDLWFNKKSVENLNVTSTNYKRNIIEFDVLSGVDYSTYKHPNRRFDIVANETIQLSTGYIVESLNDPIKQLLMSESVWIDDGTNVYPVNVNTNSLQMKKSVNEKLIAYTLDFSFAFDKIQNVR
jgi:hypothetical protein